ncbi:MAG: hypothetical protein PHV36_08915 [Elusimicrobiales bacterium]|nr:hypothetical protein [Elusimicrobiales bacterium]
MLIKSGKNRKILKLSLFPQVCCSLVSPGSPAETTAASLEATTVVSLIRSRGRIPSHPNPNHPSRSLSLLRR